MHPFRPTIPQIWIIGFVGRNGCIALRGKARSSKEELEASILSFYLERIVLDLKYHEKGIAANFSYDIMKKRFNGVMKEDLIWLSEQDQWHS